MGGSPRSNSVCWLVCCLALGMQVPILGQTPSVATRTASRTGEERPSPSPPSSAPQPGQLELEHSRVLIFVGKRGFGHDHAVVGRLTRGLLRPGNGGSLGGLEFDLKSFVADTREAREAIGLPGETDADTQRQVTDNLRSPAVLHVEKFPTATFQVVSLQQTGGSPANGETAGTEPTGPEQAWLLKGNFTLHGTTRLVEIPVKTRETNGWTHLTGRFTIKQTDYGIRPFSKAFGAVGVADELTIWGDLWLYPWQRTTP